MNQFPMYFFLSALAIAHPDLLEAFALAWLTLLLKRLMFD